MNTQTTLGCPHCGKKAFVPAVAFFNVDSYGSNSFHVCCVHCHKMVCVNMERYVRVITATNSDHIADDWGQVPEQSPDSNKAK